MKTVLYVDDEPALLDIARLFLEKTSEFKMISAESAKEGLEIIRTQHPDAIVSDYQMAGMDGIGFLKEVRKESLIPFIMFTGRGSEMVAMEATNSGADYYIQKGADPRALFAELTYKLRLALSDRREEKEEQIAKKTIRTLIDKTYNAVIIHNVEGRILDVNENLLKMFNLTREEALKLTMADLSGPESPTNIRSDIMEAVLAGHDQFLVWQARRPHDGSLFQIEKFLTRINFGPNMYILCNIRDISKVEEKQKMLLLLQYALDHAAETVICCDPLGTIVSVNQAGKITFNSASDIVGSEIMKMDPAMTPQIWNDMIEKTKDGHEIIIQTSIHGPDGAEKPGKYRCSRCDLNESFFICLYLENN